MAASAFDIIRSGHSVDAVDVEGIDKPVEIQSMTVDQALKFSAATKKGGDQILMAAYLVKLCCPAFKSPWYWPWLWTPARIKRRLSVKVLLSLADKIMELSGYSQNGVDDAEKK